VQISQAGDCERTPTGVDSGTVKESDSAYLRDLFSPIIVAKRVTMSWREGQDRPL
jgi:hypothetical protein